MTFRRCLISVLASLLLLYPGGLGSLPRNGDSPAEPAPLTKEDILETLAGSKADFAPDESTELCLTLDTPSVFARVEQGASVDEALEAVAAEKQLLSERLNSIEGIEIIAGNHYLVNTLTVRVPTEAVNAVSSLPGVAQTSNSGGYTLPVLPASQEAEDGIAPLSSSQPTTGKGQIIAVIDTGIDLSHEAMTLDDPFSVKLTKESADALIESIGYGEYYNEKIPFYYNYADGSTVMLDENNQQHGMHVAGICAGNSSSLQGVAPQAQVLAMRVFGEDSESAPDYAVVAAIEDAVRLGADVINLSLGSSFGFSSLGSEPYQQAVAAAREQGVIVVAAAGNDGRSDVASVNGRAAYLLGEPLYDNATVNAPACYDGFLSVAAAKNEQELASFSSFGPAPDLSFAPFVTALGVNIQSSVNENGYDKKSGTSMATPAVSGAFAALAQSLTDRGLLPEGAQRAQILCAILLNTAKPITADSLIASIRGQGAGLIDLDAAVASTVTATAEDGRPVVELGNLHPTEQATVEIPLVIHNLGAQEIEYQISPQQVLTEETAVTSLYCRQLDGAWMDSSDAHIFLNPGETKTVVFTLHLPSTAQGYVEGVSSASRRRLARFDYSLSGICRRLAGPHGDDRGNICALSGDLLLP